MKRSNQTGRTLEILESHEVAAVVTSSAMSIAAKSRTLI
jgi:hypothetical protein